MSKLRLPVAMAASVVALTYATSSFADDTEVTTTNRPNRTLLSTGVAIFVVSYGVTAMAGAISEFESDKKLFIPVVGPWKDLADRSCPTTCANREGINNAMLITSGVVQGAGVLMAIGSLVIPESTKSKPSVAVSPLSFGAGAGIGALGRF